MSKRSIKYEAAVERLDLIVQHLEKGDLPLDEALKLFQEGTELIQTCEKLLNDAELQIVKLSKDADGSPIETEFTDELD